MSDMLDREGIDPLDTDQVRAAGDETSKDESTARDIEPKHLPKSEQPQAAIEALERIARLRSAPANTPLPVMQQREVGDRPERAATVCAHLGLEQNPFAHHDEPSSEHRCYLWMQRDRIDVAHQSMFCLTEQSATCPWLSISSPKQAPPLHRRAAQAVAKRLPAQLDELDSSWQRILLTILVTFVTLLERAWRIAEPLLLQLGMALLVGLRIAGSILLQPLVALSRAYGRLQRRAIAGVTARMSAMTRPAASGGAAGVDELTMNIKEASVEAPTTEPELLAQEASSRAEWHTVAQGPNDMLLPSAPRSEAVPQTSLTYGAAAAEEYIHRGMEAIREGDTETALRRFRLATAADAQNEQAWLMLGAISDSRDEKAEGFRRALAINPASTRARIGLGQLGIAADPPQPKAQQGNGFTALYRAAERVDDATGDAASSGPQGDDDSDLLQSGLGAMQVGSEELAYEYFSAATKAEPTNEQAWYWRAKTAPTLDELINCLEQILRINPENAKVQVDLQWALQRRQQALAPPPAARPAAAATTIVAQPASRLVAVIRDAVQQLAAAGAFLSALMLTLPSVITLTDWQGVPEFKSYLSLLPAFQMPTIPIRTDFAPAFDLGTALPLILGVLLFHAAFGLGDKGGRWMRYWTVALSIGALILLGFYAPPTSTMLLAVPLATIVTALLGRAATDLDSRTRA